MSPIETEELKRFLEDALAKGYVVPSKSPIASPVFFIKKKDGKLRFVQDYRKLNDITVKNRYPLPLAADIINKLQGAKIFTKFDVRWGYNNVRIKEGDEWKAAFVTNQGLFEPRVVYFGLCNSPATFQALMNHVFADLIAAGKVAVYLDDILIWSNNIASHRKIVHEVLERLAQYDLYLRPEKCEFARDEMEYLGLLIREGQVGMDPAKVKAVTEWPTPMNLKDVRGFVGFANFYRRFIKDFSKICRPLHDLTKKDTPFNWGSAQADAFETLKRAFTTQPVLAMWNIDYPTRIEADASGYATGGVIAQLDPNDKLWHLIAFRSQTMSPAGRNYEIWDREMLAIIEALKNWRQFLEGLPEPFDIWTDHQNLQYWKTAQNLTRRQARWACYLAEYDFRIVHKPEKTHLIADPLSWPSSLYISDNEDNRSQIVLKPEQFKIAATAVFAKIAPLEKRIRDNSDKEQEVADALQTLRTKGPCRLQNGTLEWEEHEGLLYYKGKLYVPNSPSLRNDVIQSCYDSPTAGHPGKHATLELVSRYYWWPRVSSDVERYVLRCDQCQRYKPAPHPKATLQPQEVPPGPWEHVGVDLITQLPRDAKIKKDSVAVYVDHHSDQCHLVPVDSTVTAEGMAEVHYTDIFRLHGLPRKIFSDREPQFAARYMRALYKRLGIQTGLTTAYHPEGNGKVERKNQEVEKFLRLFVSQRQDNWVDWLPMAEFVLNSHVSSATGRTPFEIVYGYTPDFTIPAGKHSNIPALDERLDRMAHICKEAEAALRQTKLRMKEDYEAAKKRAHVFKPGDMVWLSSKDIKVHQPSPKLGPRQLGPFKVLEKVGELDYKLELPHWLKIHPVLHVNRLNLRHDQGVSKPPPPKPVQVDGEEEYTVEKILDSRLFCRQLQYKVRWKGYGAAGDSWEPAANLDHASALVKKFHRENPEAPRKLAATNFESLAASFRPFHTETEYLYLAPYDRAKADLTWEEGRRA
ncbi:polyprotein [Phanerochaete sordida]|uniref:Polyprotein n=1 Tax=Phanerochaete sordida TaxID=48140 RepID=A0A9P3GT30_9APHY|nr:polyprotein [Phanerochaete sordida]